MILTMPQFALPTTALTLALFAGAAAAQQQASEVNEAWAAFQKLPLARQQQVAGEFVEALPALPCGGDALRALAAAADAPPHERAKVRAAQRASRTIEFPHDVETLPRRVDYVFGVGVIEPHDSKEKHAAPVKPASKPAAKPGVDAPASQPGDPLVLRQALLGCVPDADRVLAVLMQRLDVDVRGDAFAAFLHGWRNDEESFYEALDRTAGTKDSVFFFDAMLNDFRGQFAAAKGDSKLAGGLKEAHDALHAAFLSYRQYRGFREAIAWSLVLPPDAPLPARLRRYEEKVAGNYSLRQQVVMVAKALDQDVDKIVAAALENAPPLPEPVWKQGYDPYPAWTARFQALQAGMIERASSTDAFLAEATTERRSLATAIAKLALERVQQAVTENKAH